MRCRRRRPRCRGVLAALLGVGLLLSRGSTVRADRMRRFDARISLARNGTLDITETLLVDFGKARRHGIYRLIPLSDTLSLKVAVVSVTDGAGKPCRKGENRQAVGTGQRPLAHQDHGPLRAA